jgi:DNA-directed RNA polymerase beta' subunit
LRCLSAHSTSSYPILRYGYTFRKEGYTKIIEYDLSQKQKAIHSALNIKRPNVLASQRKNSSSADVLDEIRDYDVEMSDEESERGEQTWSDEEVDDQGTDLHKQTNDLPKSASGKVKGARGRNERVMAPEECRAHLRRLYATEAVMCSLLFGRHGSFAPLSKDGFSFASADMFFMEAIPVAPTRFRPPAKIADTLFEHPQNELLARVLNTSYRVRDLNLDLKTVSMKTPEYDDVARRKVFGGLLDALIQLQIDVNSFIDSSRNPQPVRGGKLPPAGVRQGLEKKEGLFRKHMMVGYRSFALFFN